MSSLLPPGIGDVAEGVVTRLKVWPPELDTLRVCFFGGSKDIRSRIANVALEWTRHGAVLPLDFGSLQDPRRCLTGGENHIRVGYRYSGYWSLVGQDSYNLANQNEQSMNLALFDIRAPAEPEFSRVVLHEFGHAIGFQHEHQNPEADCEQEFDFIAIYAYLAKPPNNWPPEVVDHNMRSLNPVGLATTTFDAGSIMLYTFPPEFYHKGQNSPCYAEENTTLSSGDLELALDMYPPDRNVAVARIADALSTYTEQLSAAAVAVTDRARALSQAEALSAPGLSSPERRATIEQLTAPAGLN